MKKRIFLLALCALLLAAACAQAKTMYVVNPGGWDQRLHLRTKPDKSAPSLGRYYTGVRVQVLGQEGEWCRVRIASGLRGARPEGYMMAAYLRSPETTNLAAYIPVETAAADCRMLNASGQQCGSLRAGETVFVLAFCGERLHVMNRSGTMGYIGKAEIAGELSEPQGDARVLVERLAVASGGTALYDGTGDGAAQIGWLYGGVPLYDAMLSVGEGCVLVGLGDDGDELRGWIRRGGFTWMDNGANCAEEYAVYETDEGIVEVLGVLEDGRHILKLTDDAESDPVVTLSSRPVPQGAQLLARNGAYFVYSRPLNRELSDQAAIDAVLRQTKGHTVVDQLTGESVDASILQTLTPRVIRYFDPQYRHRMLFVAFYDDQGRCRVQAELYPESGELLAVGANG